MKKRHIALFLIVATVALYGQILSHDFVSFDDDAYIYENPMVLSGLNPDSIFWAFKSFTVGNWQPITMLSHMLDVQIFGSNPGGHHFTSLVIHVFNVLLLFYLLLTLTENIFVSTLTALLFAIHPMNVESVAWVSQRKTLLCTFFWLSSLGMYVRYVHSRNPFWYRWSLFLFAAGLMSKPTIVTLPWTLFLLDFWPLQRFLEIKKKSRFTVALALLKEKLPFLLMALAFGLFTIVVQEKAGAMNSLEIQSGEKIINGIVSYSLYILHLLWPFHLSFHYAFPPPWSAFSFLLSFLFLGVVSYIVFAVREKFPTFAFGWFWYLGTMVTMIGFIQVGSQGMADRYSYVPFIGLFIVLSEILTFLSSRARTSLAVILVLGFSIASFSYVQTWKNSESAYLQALEVNPDNSLMRSNYGYWLNNQNRFLDALEHLKVAIKIKPNYPQAHNNLGISYKNLNRPTEALEHFRKAVEFKPDYFEAVINLGSSLQSLGAYDEALKHFNKAIELRPFSAKAHGSLGESLTLKGDCNLAVQVFEKSIELDPNYAPSHFNLAACLSILNQRERGRYHYEVATQLNPQLRKLKSSYQERNPAEVKK